MRYTPNMRSAFALRGQSWKPCSKLVCHNKSTFSTGVLGQRHNFRLPALTNFKAKSLRNNFSTTTTYSNADKIIVDVRSDTVTKPSREMITTAMNADLGDDVFGEDLTVIKLQKRVADILSCEAALFVPTGTMGNSVAIAAHCQQAFGGAIVGANSHIAKWEAGNISNAAGVYAQQIVEDVATGQMDLDFVTASITNDDDDHYVKTQAVCIENTQNTLGGIALSLGYIQQLKGICDSKDNVALHLDGARLWNAAVYTHSQNSSTSPQEALCNIGQSVDSITVCLSKGLGAPLGSVVAGTADFIRLAKRARKRLGGGMRQVGVIAAMGLYALDEHWPLRLVQDQEHAQYLARELRDRFDMTLLRRPEECTNMVFFKPPLTHQLSMQEFCTKLQDEHGVLTTHGYSVAGQYWIRAVMHLDVTDNHIEHMLQAIDKVLAKT